MRYFVVFASLVVFTGILYVPTRGGYSRITCPEPTIENGRYLLRRRGTIVKFSCYSGYLLTGTKRTFCIRGRWRHPFPICTHADCDVDEVGKLEHGMTITKSNRAIIMFLCDPGYELEGSSEIYCHGRTWNDTAPTCRSTTAEVPLKCDFESRDLCGWEQDPSHDFDWSRRNFNETDSGYVARGPRHDHTIPSKFDGHYLYIEANGKRENSVARIMSPLYSADLTENGCFSFWHHMHGESIGSLIVYFAEEGGTEKIVRFNETGNQADRWLNGVFYLPKSLSNFQIVIEGSQGRDVESGIAIDDVAILQGKECSDRMEATTESTIDSESGETESEGGSWWTCRGRCSEDAIDPTRNCQCNNNCADNSTCCPDYFAYCDTDESTTGVEEVTRDIATPRASTVSRILTVSPGITLEIPVTSRVRDTATSIAPRKSMSTVVVTTYATSIRPTTRSKNGASSSITSLAPKITNVDHDSERQTSADPGSSAKLRHDTGKVTWHGIIAIVVGSLVFIGAVACVGFVLHQRRHGYKKGCGQSSYPGDSDVRFLTSDEVLDFSMAKPEDA